MKPFDQLQGYYRRREQQERELAAVAMDEAAKQIHSVLAEKYRQLADGSGSSALNSTCAPGKASPGGSSDSK